MRKTVLLSTAAVLTSVTLAAAQMGPPGGGERQMPGAAGERSQGSSGGREPGTTGGRGERLQMQERGAQSREMQQRPGESREAPQAQRQQERTPDRGTVGQAPRDAQPQRKDAEQQQRQRKDAESQQRQQKDAEQQQRQKMPSAQQQRKDDDRGTVGQAPREQRRDAQQQLKKQEPSAQQQRKEDDRGTVGQAPRDTQRQDAQQQRQQQQPSAAQQQAAPGSGQTSVQADAQGRVTLNTEQRTRIQQSVLASADVPRVSRVDFALSVNTVVPTHVSIVDVPPALIEINPSWRGHKYFVVEEEIIVVTPERRIVAVIPAGRAHARTGSGGSLAVDLSREEIIILQRVLVDRGFSVEVDGVFGPSTREALVAFQRREGLEASGRIDTRTVSALGVEGRIKVSGDAASGTVGSGQSSQQQTGAQQQPGQQQQPSAQQQGQRPGTDRQQQTTGTGPGKESQKSQQGTTGSAPSSQDKRGTTGSTGSQRSQQQGTEMQRQPDTGGQKGGGGSGTPQR